MATHSKEFLDAVWAKGTVVSGNDPTVWRKDQCGAWIRRSLHGNCYNQYGWEVDRISPGGPYTIGNCRPLQWRNNRDKGDGRLKCKVSASGVNNVDADRRPVALPRPKATRSI